MSKVTVLGGGGWAIALAKILYGNGHDVTIWSALQKEVDLLSKDRENKISLAWNKNSRRYYNYK